MMLLKKITILKLIIIVVICIIMVSDANRMMDKIPYLFNLFMMLISTVYVVACFKFVNNKDYSIKYFIVANVISIITLFPLMTIIFDGLFPVYSCLFFSLSIADSVFFGLTLYKFAFDKINNGTLLKLIMSNVTSKK